MRRTGLYMTILLTSGILLGMQIPESKKSETLFYGLIIITVTTIVGYFIGKIQKS